ncbi:sterol desaturase family protein [uncultured Shewanella sp.]|uniref:sterol desaturase family protein n=1 Tax=uncultured Shewanella sp. TaxID=173975 RepID=UPI00261464B2|nr:sterol desaturase family protein [uncultured Shewanella sp.]
MIDEFYNIIGNVGTALQHLIFPMLFFCLFAYLLKRKQAVTAFRTSLPNSIFNISIMCFNLIFISLISNHLKWLYSIDIGESLSQIWASLPEWLVILSAVFCGDFIGYWRHRFEHSRILWPSHAMHHSDTQMSWLTLQRFHPFNRISTLIIDTGLLMCLGFPPYALVANNLVRHYYGYFIHADLPWNYGAWNKVFVSPVMHQWHHAADPAAYHTNFATIFSIFDRAFGTYRVPGLCHIPLGVSYNVGGSILGQLLYPFKLSSYLKKSEAPQPKKIDT